MIDKKNHRPAFALLPAAVAAARAMLNPIVARATQAAFAAYFPDGRCANGPSLSSAITCSMIA